MLLHSCPNSFVCEWLHETAPQPLHAKAATGYWKFTKQSIMQPLRTDLERDGLVTQMDPDAMEGKTLAADDVVSSPLHFEPHSDWDGTELWKGPCTSFIFLHLCRMARWCGIIVQESTPGVEVSKHSGSLLFSWKAIGVLYTPDTFSLVTEWKIGSNDMSVLTMMHQWVYQ